MKVFENIMQHLDLLEALTNASQGLLAAAQNGKVDLVDQIIDNRERLINIIRKVQTNVEEEIAKFDLKTVTPEHIQIFKTWSQEVNQIVYVNDKLDIETTEILTNQKEQTTQEIASVFKNRQSFKGYDLSNVKK
ncbi:hypothetical protein [Bacteriovorax sp. Seq25_V]|uniref:hypothetical protein n=1 Tax=Bacteriovorax sp. Seq25_V TaxID=1201288 RepID=UPI00038A2455|nr:hypothetical protein [Bacteriovorax sp. Seq25_V]EQC43267.1 hypothetical protein M900_0169 [Bacteriovorax sp. Seq25_V]